jgi:hypothetical protein
MQQTAYRSSRLEQYEQKKAVKQTIILVVFGVLFLILFVFLLLPGFVKIFFSLRTPTGTGISVNDNIPPLPPTIEPYSEYTNQTGISFSGYAEAGAEVSIVLNGTASTIKADDTGKYQTGSLTLSEGENTIAFFVTDADGNTSKTVERHVTYDTQSPALTIESPSQGSVYTRTKDQVVTLTGLTEQGSSLMVNDRLIVVDVNGRFSSSFSLNEGENQLKFVAKDKAGNTTEQTLTLTYRP